MGETVEVEGRDLTCPGIAMAKHGTDCYFYYNSTCTAGDTCKFRHSKAAVGSDAVCFLWEKGRCSRPDCKFRHSKKKKKERPCYWERQPQGCQNPRCAFSHERPRNTDGIFSTPNKSVKSELGLSRKRGKKMKDFGEVVNQEVSFMPPQKVFKSVRERLTWPADPIAASQAETSTAPAFTTPKTTKRGMRAPFAKGKKHWRHEKQKGYRRLHKQKTPNEECHVAPEESPPFSAELQPTVDDASPKQCLSPPQCLNTRSPPQSDNLKETAASSSTFSASAEEQYEDILTEFASNSQGEDMDPCLGERPLTDLIQELVDYANMC